MIRKPWNKNYICVNSKQTSFNCIQCWSCPELQLCILEVVAVIRVIYPRKGSRVDFWFRKHFMMWRSLYVMEFKYKRQHDFGNAVETLVHKGLGAKWMDCPYNWWDIKSKTQLDVNHYWLEVKADGIIKGEDNYKIKSWCKCCCLYTSSQYVQVENVSCSQSVDSHLHVSLSGQVSPVFILEISAPHLNWGKQDLSNFIWELSWSLLNRKFITMAHLCDIKISLAGYN